MIKNDDIFQFVTFVVNKNLNGAFTPKSYNNAARAANLSLFDNLRGGSYSTYSPGRPVPVIGMEENETLSEELDPFIKVATVAVASSIATQPFDLIQTLSLSSLPGNKPIKWVKKGDLPEYLNSSIDFPTVDEGAIYTNVGGGWYVYPTLITSIQAFYLRTPVTPIWNYTAVSNQAVYNPAGTVDFEWKPSAFMILSSMILGFLGFNMSNDELVGYSAKMKSEAK